MDRDFADVGEKYDLARKRDKFEDLDAVSGSESRGIDTPYYTKKWMEGQASDSLSASAKDMCRVNEKTVTMNLDVTQSVEMKKGASQRPSFDLNAAVDMTGDSSTPIWVDNMASNSNLNIRKSGGIGFDLFEYVSSSANRDQVSPNEHCKRLKLRADLGCRSTFIPVVENDATKVWKAMKHNDFMSSSHGCVPMRMPMPTPMVMAMPSRRYTNTDAHKKNMEIARREQVDRFAKVAAPIGLLNGLNPGIINHVRNRKQVHSIIEAIVRSERCDDLRTGKKQEKIQNKTDNTHSSDDRGKHALKVASSATMATQNISTQCDKDDSVEDSSISSLSFQAAEVAFQWLEHLQKDITRRLGALTRSKKRVQAVIETELPLLISKEFSQNKENNPDVTKLSVPNLSVSATADMHNARWGTMFRQMEMKLSEEERQLEDWLNQVKDMQLECYRGLSQNTRRPGMQKPGTSESDCRRENVNDSAKMLSVRAIAAAFYSTCNFAESGENKPNF